MKGKYHIPIDPYYPPPPGDIPFDPYQPPPPGADSGKYDVKGKGDIPFDPYQPPPPGSVQDAQSLSKVGAGQGVLEFAHRPGYYGQIFAPCFIHAQAYDWFYATPMSGERPSFFQEIIVHPGNYFPQAANPDFQKKRLVYENCSPICVSSENELERDDREYVSTDFSTVPGIDGAKYNHQNFVGYMTLPIGNLDFMTQNNINGAAVHNPYKQYDFRHPTTNSFSDPTFIDPNFGGSAVLNYTVPNPIIGHLVVPVFKAGEMEKWYNNYNKDNQLRTPTQLSSTQIFNQVVFVPKGTPYDVLHNGLSHHDKIGFLVVPVGDMFYSFRRYFNATVNPDWNRTRIVEDEQNRKTTVPDTEEWKAFLSLAAGERDPFFWRKGYKRMFNKKRNAVGFWAEYKEGYAVLIHPIGRWRIAGPTGSAQQTTTVVRAGDIPFDPYQPPPPGG